MAVRCRGLSGHGVCSFHALCVYIGNVMISSLRLICIRWMHCARWHRQERHQRCVWWFKVIEFIWWHFRGVHPSSVYLIPTRSSESGKTFGQIEGAWMPWRQSFFVWRQTQDENHHEIHIPSAPYTIKFSKHLVTRLPLFLLYSWKSEDIKLRNSSSSL